MNLRVAPRRGAWIETINLHPFRRGNECRTLHGCEDLNLAEARGLNNEEKFAILKRARKYDHGQGLEGWPEMDGEKMKGSMSTGAMYDVELNHNRYSFRSAEEVWSFLNTFHSDMVMFSDDGWQIMSEADIETETDNERRILIWRSYEDSENDDGSMAIGEVRKSCINEVLILTKRVWKG